MLFEISRNLNESQGSISDDFFELGNRLSAVMFNQPLKGFSSICTITSNAEAVESALLFSTGYASQVAMFGASGSGKTHILEAAYNNLRKKDRPVHFITADRFMRSMSYVQFDGALIIDDCQTILKSPKQKLLFRISLERRVRSKKPTMIAVSTSSRQADFAPILPTMRSWECKRISEPSLEDRIRLVRHISKQESLNLSTPLVQILARHLLGSCRILRGALHRLRVQSQEWSDPRKVLSACGVLDMYLADDPEWDIKHEVMKLASSMDEEIRTGIVAFTLLRTIGLNEDSVCRFMGLSVSKCLNASDNFARKLTRSAQVVSEEHRFIQRLIERLSLKATQTW